MEERYVLKLVKMEVDSDLGWVFESLLDKVAKGWTQKFHEDRDDYSKQVYYAWLSDYEKDLITDSWSSSLTMSSEPDDTAVEAEVIYQEEVDDAQGD